MLIRLNILNWHGSNIKGYFLMIFFTTLSKMRIVASIMLMTIDMSKVKEEIINHTYTDDTTDSFQSFALDSYLSALPFYIDHKELITT